MSQGRRRAYVVGGGVAGLAAAFGLADRGYEVSLLESRRRCGGRAFSSPDRVLWRVLDNGNHVMLGCYDAMRRLLRRLGTEHLFERQPGLHIAYRSVDQRTTELRLSRLPVPLAMPWRLLTMAMPLGARLRALWGMASVALGAPAHWTLADWLRKRRQSGDPDQVLWRPLCRAVMNTEPEEAAAADFLATLRQAFLGSAGRAAMWIPSRPWSELLEDPTPAALAKAGVELQLGARVVSLATHGGRVSQLRLGDGRTVAVAPRDVVVSAVPWHALPRLLPSFAAPLRSAPIVTANFELPAGAAAPRDDGPVVALVGGQPFHFLLRTPGEPVARFALLSGGSRAFDGLPVDAIASLAREQVQRYYRDAELAHATVRIRKEQHATFVAAPGSRAARPHPGRLADGPSNLWICGDWTDTGLPATLEGAARSAEACLRALDQRDPGSSSE